MMELRIWAYRAVHCYSDILCANAQKSLAVTQVSIASVHNLPMQHVLHISTRLTFSQLTPLTAHSEYECRSHHDKVDGRTISDISKRVVCLPGQINTPDADMSIRTVRQLEMRDTQASYLSCTAITHLADSQAHHISLHKPRSPIAINITRIRRTQQRHRQDE